MNFINAARGRWRWLTAAVVAGIWCSGWSWLLVFLTQPYPGVITGTPNGGAREVVELLLGRSYGWVLLTIFLFCALLVLLVAGLRRWMDPLGRARSAMIWPFRSGSLVAVTGAWTGAVVLGALLDFPFKAAILVTVALAGLVFLLVFPFWSWNPRTLAQPSPERWWRPRSPAIKTVAMVLSLLALGWVASVLVESTALLVRGPVALGLWVIADALLLIFFLPAAAVWLANGDCRLAIGLTRHATERGLIYEYLYQYVVLSAAVLLLLLPLLPMALLAIFVIPQLDQWLAGSGQPTPAWFAWGAGMASTWWLSAAALVLPIALYQALATGRVLGAHGIGPPRADPRGKLALGRS